MAKAAVYITEATTKGNPVRLDSLKSIFIPILSPELALAIGNSVKANKSVQAYYLDLADDAVGITAYDVVQNGVPL